ncbi:Integrator complex subunit 11 [Conglomerata obtusa]
MRVVCLGAGQDVGRSCIIVTIQGYTIMLDCGMHMGYTDNRKFPDFSYLTGNKGNINKYVDCVIISHFHLDHCGALPFFTETIGYDGPIYMTHPTKAICPILLEDYRKISLRIGDKNRFTAYDIKKCMEKVICVNIGETYEHEPNFTLKAYPAGHVLGAAMFYIKINDESFVYTGDYNMTADKHLGSAWIDCLRPDLLITESTYGNVIRDCRKAKERDFLNSVFECVKGGGKVLIPIFALGRAQEMCLLIDSYWERMNLKVPVYLSMGMTEKANQIYRLFINYTNETIRKKILERNLFDFKNIQPLDKSVIDQDGPMVIFSSPGMLHSGQSLSLFLKICHDENNMIIIPGYCVRGTVGHDVLNGAKTVIVYNKSYDVNLKVKNLAFSAHADAKGILELIRQCQPRNVMLVHGDKLKMKVLKKNIEKDFNITTFAPENGRIVDIPKKNEFEMKIQKELLETIIDENENEKKISLKFTAILDDEIRNTYKIIDVKNFIDKNV